MLKRFSLLFFAGVLVTSLIHAQSAKPVIIDTDIGDDIDDAFALSLALRSPELRVIGVVTAFGDTTLRAHMTARMLKAAGKPKIPIGIGVKTDPKTDFTQSEYAKGDNSEIASNDGVELILSAARKQPGKVTLIAIGPLINIGAAIDRDPAAFRKLKQVVMMGGSIRRGYGDRTSKPEPEWNTKNSVEQTRKLLAAGVPVYLFPLDSTQIVLPEDFKHKLAASNDPLNRDLAEILREGKRSTAKLYDAVAVSHLLAPSLCPVSPMRITVDDNGLTRQVAGKPNANVCLVSDEKAFLALLEKRLVR